MGRAGGGREQFWKRQSLAAGRSGNPISWSFSPCGRRWPSEARSDEGGTCIAASPLIRLGTMAPIHPFRYQMSGAKIALFYRTFPDLFYISNICSQPPKQFSYRIAFLPKFEGDFFRVAGRLIFYQMILMFPFLI